ncbi:hypothetical protein Q8G48_28725, partial [Klebsiella pneumoniae]|uniref:hypothetical protein n=1 Tax=Klebsiella pneumoniae TaxID=573 RepID=UPI00301385F9
YLIDLLIPLYLTTICCSFSAFMPSSITVIFSTIKFNATKLTMLLSTFMQTQLAFKTLPSLSRAKTS